jgi:hypothetical protein
MNNKDITQAALFKNVNLNKQESKYRGKNMIKSYREQGIGLKNRHGFTRQ